MLVVVNAANLLLLSLVILSLLTLAPGINMLYYFPRLLVLALPHTRSHSHSLLTTAAGEAIDLVIGQQCNWPPWQLQRYCRPCVLSVVFHASTRDPSAPSTVAAVFTTCLPA